MDELSSNYVRIILGKTVSIISLFSFLIKKEFLSSLKETALWT
jgi:hypothetical protein